MRRGEFIVLLGAVAAWPLGVRAQQSDRMRQVAILMPYPPGDADTKERVSAFRDELQKRGWASGVNARFGERWTGDNLDLIRSAASSLVESNPDAILATGARVVPILMELTHSIPIVVVGGTDPVARGYAETLAHPGHNITGFAAREVSVFGKMLQILKDVAPNVSRVSVMYNPDNPATAYYASEFESVAGPLRIEPAFVHVRGLSEIEQAVAAAAQRPNGGILVGADVTILPLREQVVEAVARYRVPAVYSEGAFARSGGLVSYGTDRIDLFRRAASYVDRILRGEKPGDLPYQQPTKYELVINLKTAKALGLTIPQAFLLTADEVIE
jgi:putative ABC transport system substrate-binding protein